MNLVGTRHVHHREQRAYLDPGEGFFMALARGGCLHGLAILHETGRHGPISQPRLDGALAEQNLVLPLGHAAEHQQWVLVVHRAAGGADETRQMIAVRYLGYDRRAAIAAEIHRPV